MRILVVTSGPAGCWSGDRVTAERWAGLFRRIGHGVKVVPEFRGQACDLMVALHAHKSHASAARFRRERPDAPLVLALTGTDLYDDIHTSARARSSLQLASRLVVLQPLGLAELPKRLREKARVIHQSASKPTPSPKPGAGSFDVCVLANLRAVKDPLRVAHAVRHLPADSRVRVLHAGEPLDEHLARRAEAEASSNARYRWLGGVSWPRALRLLCRSRLLVITSRLDGGANVLSEALACGVPVLSTRVPGSVGLLGRRYPGYFTAGDGEALAGLLRRAETDPRFYRRLGRVCRRRAPLVDPARERRRWERLLHELRPGSRA